MKRMYSLELSETHKIIETIPRRARQQTCGDQVDYGLASAYRRSEDVAVFAIVVAELELGDVQWQVLFADLMEAAHNAALNQGPEAVRSTVGIMTVADMPG
jgi:hypothetical protein